MTLKPTINCDPQGLPEYNKMIQQVQLLLTVNVFFADASTLSLKLTLICLRGSANLLLVPATIRTLYVYCKVQICPDISIFSHVHGLKMFGRT